MNGYKFNNGIYFYQIKVNGKIVQSDKLIMKRKAGQMIVLKTK